MNSAAKLRIVHDDADTLLALLAPDEPVTFQTFDDSPGHKDPRLIRVLHGTLAQHRQMLTDLNMRGAGIFWMVNAGDGKGRKATNVRRVRALFVDLDGAPLDPVKKAPLAPHAIVESSPARWHAYWRVSDCPLADFNELQLALIARFDSDGVVHDLPRVLRLPGFEHRKGEPFTARIVALDESPPYTLAAFREAFGFVATAALPAPRTHPQPRRQRRTLSDRIPTGERNDTLLSLASGFVRRGFNAQDVNGRIQKINAERCDPPLGADEVDGIVDRAIGYGSSGWAPYTHKLHDAMTAADLPNPSRLIVMTALRRYDGTDTGFALTHEDCRGIQGCRNEDRFLAYRQLAVDSGFLLLAKPHRMTQNGTVPNLYTLPTSYLPANPTKRGVSANPTKRGVLHKQTVVRAVGGGHPDNDHGAASDRKSELQR